MNKKIKKCLSISGGGSKGSFGGGTIQALYEKYNKDYDLIVGCSTGSLLMTLASIKKMNKLKEGYTNVTQKSIFKINPFDKHGNIKILNSIWRILKGKNTLGDSSNLLKTLKKFFTEEDFDLIKSSNKEIVATVTNITKECIEYKSSKNCSYDDMCEWVYASACIPLFMSIVTKENNEYVDGGLIDHIPIQYAIDQGATEVDVIVHTTKNITVQQCKISSIMHLFDKTISTMHKEITRDDIEISKLKASNNNDVILNFYYTPYELTDNSLIFNKEKMLEWWDLGYNNIINDTYTKKTIKLTKSGKIRETN